MGRVGTHGNCACASDISFFGSSRSIFGIDSMEIPYLGNSRGNLHVVHSPVMITEL